MIEDTVRTQLPAYRELLASLVAIAGVSANAMRSGAYLFHELAEFR